MKKSRFGRAWLLILVLLVFCLGKRASFAATGDTVTLEAYNYSGYYVRHAKFVGRLDANVTPVNDRLFVECSGLADSNYVSWQSVNYPGYYLRHKNYRIYLEANDGSALFKKDATFKKVSGLADSSCYSFQSYNLPQYYIRHQNFVLKLSVISAAQEREDATFKVTTATAASVTSATGTSGATFYNPRDTSVQRPDPYVYKDQDTGYYYGLHTVMDSGGYDPKIKLYRSKSLSNLFLASNGKVIWTATSGNWNDENVWAPEFFKINGVWYIYYSANWRIGILSCSATDPYTGTWTDRGALTAASEAAIDGTILQQNGSLYLLYSRSISGTQYLYIRKLSSPTALASGSAVLLSAPTYSWEKQGLNVNEGPEILQYNGKTFCIYSASYCATMYYCLGMLSCSGTADPMVAGNWTKNGSPVFSYSSANGLYGVGHCSFTKSPDDSEDWLVYHGCVTASSSTYQPRYVCMQKFSWNSDGTPNFGTPQGRYSALACPSGE